MPCHPPARWLPAAATPLWPSACSGTLLVIPALGGLGVALTLNEAVWAATIVPLAVLVVGLGFRRHRTLLSVALGSKGAAILVFTLFVAYRGRHRDSPLAAGALADCRLTRRERVRSGTRRP